MDAEPKILHVAFFPLMSAGHMIPTLDMAKLFAAHNVKTTIITTPMNASFFTEPLKTYTNAGPPISVEIIPFPSKEAGLPEGVENLDQFTSDYMSIKFFIATKYFRESLEKVIEKCKPNCFVVGLLLPYAMDVAAKFDIPRLVFHGGNCFSQCVNHTLFKNQPCKSISCNDEEFVIPNLPHEIKITKNKIPEMMRGEEVAGEASREWMKFFSHALEAEEKSYCVIVNTFYELEPDYVDYNRNVMGRKVWHIGPLSLCNRENEAKSKRGKDSSIDVHECMKWLDSKKPNSVVYVCFGSLAEVSTSQLHEIAMGLEDCSQDFIWVVRRSNKEDENEEWLPHQFEKRMEGKGLIIRGWAPQVLILKHEAMGAFVTHCGWNSTLEGISYGVPMVTWPVFAEQFTNEILVTDILKLGVSVGAKKWNRVVEGVKREDIEKAIRRVMVGEEALEMRSRVKKIKEMARETVQVGGSSYNHLSALIQDLRSYKSLKL